MSCEQCSLKFNVLRWRKTCTDCHHDFCSSCIMRFKGSEKLQRCHRCRVFFSIPLDRQALMGLRVRDLLWYLNSKAVSFAMCKEKSELVDLIIQCAADSSSRSVINRPPPPPPPTITTESPRPQNFGLNCDSNQLNRGCWSAQSSPSLSRGSHPGPSTQDDINVVPQTPETIPPENLLNSAPSFSSTQSVNSEDSSDPVIGGSISVTVEDIKTIEEIYKLTVRQLKLVLTRSYVDYKGCCEKQELQDRVKRLWEQRQKCPDIEAIKDEHICKICMEAPIDSVLLECGHMVTCTTCGKQLSECPICRQYVVRVVHTFNA